MKCPRCKKGDLFFVEYDMLIKSTPIDDDGLLVEARLDVRQENSSEISCNNCSFRIDLENNTQEEFQEKFKIITEKQ